MRCQEKRGQCDSGARVAIKARTGHHHNIQSQPLKVFSSANLRCRVRYRSVSLQSAASIKVVLILHPVVQACLSDSPQRVYDAFLGGSHCVLLRCS